MPKAVGWSNIPAEMKERRQWCVSNHTHPEPRFRKAPRSPGGNTPLASVTDPSQWGTFDEAAMFAWNQGTDNWSIGFVLTADDPFCVIDLDIKDSRNAPGKPELWTSPERMEEYWQMAQEADTYVERSLSGKSLHIIAKANIGAGCRKDGVEIYSQERYIILTGDVVIDKPPRDAQQMMEKTVLNLRSESDDSTIELVELEEADTDEEVLTRAFSASNADKFKALFDGKWQESGYKSHSEADLALLSMLAFYSQSNEQCRRLFRLSGLGQREKAQKNNRYLDLTLSIVRSRQEKAKIVDISAILKAGELLSKLHANLGQQPAPAPVPAQLPPAPASVATAAQVAQPSAIVLPEDLLSVPKEMATTPLEWPPGQMGEVARFIYQSSPRPIREVSIVGALGFAAGVCGKAFMIPQSGLNIYLVLVGLSAIGKEAMHSGIAAILESMRSRNPLASRFVDFSEFASGPALIKACIANPSFVNVSGEFGKRMRRMAEDAYGRDVAMSSLRTTMTNLYQKSGPTSIVGGISYSQKENNVQSVSGVAYSLIGETTPSAYYESLTESMMEDGFLSRFTMVESTGNRPAINLNAKLEPDRILADYLSELCSYALPRAGGHQRPVLLQRTKEAHDIVMAFEYECDNQINSTRDERKRQMWNRASLKAQRIAGLIAAVDNYIVPMITAEHVNWGINLILRDIDLMDRKFRSGDIGKSDDTRERKLMSIVRNYLTESPSEGYKIDPRMRADSVVSKAYLSLRTSSTSVFCNHRMGASAALDQTIRNCIDNGYLVEVDRVKAAEAYQFHGKAYRIVQMPPYLI